jgi:hypothetical protein
VDFLERDQLACLAVAALEDLRSSVMLEWSAVASIAVVSSKVQYSAMQCRHTVA